MLVKDYIQEYCCRRGLGEEEAAQIIHQITVEKFAFQLDAKSEWILEISYSALDSGSRILLDILIRSRVRKIFYAHKAIANFQPKTAVIGYC